MAVPKPAPKSDATEVELLRRRIESLERELRQARGIDASADAERTHPERNHQGTQDQLARRLDVVQRCAALSGDPQQVIERVVALIGEVLEVPLVGVSEFHGDAFALPALYDRGAVARDPGVFPIVGTPCARVRAAETAQTFGNVSQSFPAAAFLVARDAQFYCGTPACDQTGEVVGVTFVCDQRARTFSADETELLVALARRVGVELERRRIIAARDRAEHSQADRERLYRAAVDAGDAVVYQLDFAQNQYVYVGDGIEHLLGYSPAEFTPQYWVDFAQCERVHRPASGVTREDASRMFLAGKLDQWWAEFKCETADGGTRWLSDCSAPITDAEGRVCGSLGFLQDVTESKRAQQELRKTQFAVDHAADAIYWVQADGRISYVNRAACRMLGYTHDELVTMSVPDIDPDFPSDVWPERWRAMKDAGSSTFPAHHRGKNGAVFPVEITTDYFEFEGHEYMWAYVRDVSERERDAEALRRSEHELRTITDNLPILIARVDAQRRFRFVNKEYERWFRRPAAEFLGRRVCDVLREENFRLVRLKVDAALAGDVIRFETPLLVDGLRRRWADCTFIPDRGEDGGVRGFYSLMRDVTARKKSDEVNRRLFAAIEAAGEAIMITDVESRIEYVNSAFERLHGWSRGETVGRTPQILKSGKHDDAFYEQMWKTIGRGEIWKGTLLNHRKDGTLVDVDETIAPVIDAAGRITHYIAVERDISERVRTAEELRRQQAELAHISRLSVMGELATGIAHELNQPLTAIVNSAESALNRVSQESVNTDELRIDLHGVAEQAERAGRIIRRMRDHVGRRKPARSSVRLNELIPRVLLFFEAELRTSKIELEINSDSELPLVNVDRVQIEQVLVNLIRNAIDALGAAPLTGRLITIHTSTSEPTRVECGVSDNGPGISEYRVDNLFTPFTTSKPGGLGMGLSITRSIIESHGGRIWVAQRKGGGASFRFTLPIAGEQGAGHAE